jgi:hypothetical protein
MNHLSVGAFASEDGFPVYFEFALRSPHSPQDSKMSILVSVLSIRTTSRTILGLAIGARELLPLSHCSHVINGITKIRLYIKSI